MPMLIVMIINIGREAEEAYFSDNLFHIFFYILPYQSFFDLFSSGCISILENKFHHDTAQILFYVSAKLDICSFLFNSILQTEIFFVLAV